MPLPPDPEMGDQNTDLQAYGLAAKAGDQEAMGQLHSAITSRQTRMSARMNSPTADPDTPTFLEGVGRGMHRIYSGAKNLVGAEPDADLKEEDRIDKPLLSTTSGKWGDVAGQVAATLPIGMAGGAALGAAGKALPWATRGLAGVGTRAGVAAGENAAASELGGQDAGEGAGAGALLSVAGGAGGKLVRGLVGKSDTAQRLYQDAAEEGKDLFIPISQGGTGVSKQIYQKALPYALGVESQLKGQSQKAKSVMGEVAAEHGMAPQVDEAGQLQKTPAPIGNTMEQTAADMRSTYDQAYDRTIKGYSFKPPNDFRASVLDNLSDSGLPPVHKSAIANKLEQVLGEHLEEDGTLTGANLLSAKEKAQQALEGLKSPAGFTIGNKGSTEKALGSFDDIVQSAIDEHKSMGATKGAPEVARDLENFQRLGPAYEGGNAVASTAESNIPNRGELNFGKLATNAPPNSPLRSMGQDVHEVLEKESPGTVNPAGRHLLHSLAPIAAFTGHPAMALTGVGLNLAGNALATKTAQKALYGDLASQQTLARFLRANPQLAHGAGFAGRQGAIDAS